MSFRDEYRAELDEVRLDEEARARISQALAEAQAEEVAPRAVEHIGVPVGVRLVEPTSPKTARRQRYWRFGVWVPAAAFAACALFLLVALPAALLGWGGLAATPHAPVTDATLSDETLASLDSRATAGSYAAIYQTIAQLSGNRWEERGVGEVLLDKGREALGIGRDEGDVTDDATMSSPTLSLEAESGDFLSNASKESAMGGGSDHDYTSTNVQVEGVDEADIVKTDGAYLYILSNNRLVIARADGKHTRVVSDTRITRSPRDTARGSTIQRGGTPKIAIDDAAVDDLRIDEGADIVPIEMFLDGERLIIIVTEYDFAISDVSSEIDYGYVEPATPRLRGPLGLLRDIIFGSRLGDSTQWMDDIVSREIYDPYVYQPRSRTFALTFDIADPARPRHLASSGQDGEYVTSRMLDGVVYLITTHYVWDRPVAEHPRTFVPSLYDDERATALSAGCIIIPDQPQDTSYVVITSLSTKTGAHLDGQSLLGYTSTVYMSRDSLIIAHGVYDDRVVEEWVEDQYLVQRRVEGVSTHLIRFSLDAGRLTYEAEGAVPGELLNQFALDQYRDTIRLVTTIWGSEMKVYTDKKRGFENYEYVDSPAQTNALFVLDENLEVIGKLGELAPGEQVYSVRFAGDVAYFVTFRQVDPLFTVDLSNPRAPRVLSALKIPGFSQYLHVWDRGLLFGLGMEADEETGRTETMKLAMFDTTDPTDVFERDKLVLDSYWSEALYNHKAILISPDRGIIAFPTDEGFVVFSYSPRDGFAKRGQFLFADSYGARGVIIDDTLYVCSPSAIGVFTLRDFSPLVHIVLSEGPTDAVMPLYD